MKLFKTCTLAVALSTLALTGMAQAQGQMMAPPPPPMMDSAMAPMPASGTVLRYYVDRAGFVSAMDVQTADGVRMIRFSPSMAQTLTTMYPVGSTANVYVTSGMSGGMTNYYLAGTGPAMPTPTAMMMPMTVSDLDVLKAEPYIMLGAKTMFLKGRLDGYVTDPKSGEVLALVVSGGDKKTLVRVPRVNRLVPSGMAPEGITPLTKGALVVFNAYPEAPRYGVVSPYDARYVATSISVDGNTLGPLGFGTVKNVKKSTLLGLNLNLPGILGGSSPEEVMAADTGYTTYETPSAMVAPAPAPAPAM